MKMKITNDVRMEVKIEMRMQIIEICNDILYSNNEQKIARGYDRLFGEYRHMFLHGMDAVLVSCIEEVIVKMMKDNDEMAYHNHGVKYSPVQKFMALVREQLKMYSTMTYSGKLLGEIALKKNRYKSLTTYLLIYLSYCDKITDDPYIRETLKKCLEN